MTPLEIARLEYEVHSELLLRALGRGGARVDLDRARAELTEVQVALDAVAVALGRSP